MHLSTNLVLNFNFLNSIKSHQTSFYSLFFLNTIFISVVIVSILFRDEPVSLFFITSDMYAEKPPLPGIDFFRISAQMLHLTRLLLILGSSEWFSEKDSHKNWKAGYIMLFTDVIVCIDAEATI
jgi:hypothetical protein